MSSSEVLHIDFAKPKSARRKYESMGSGVFRSEDGHFYERPTIHRRRTWRRLKSRTLRHAIHEIQTKRADHGRAKLGLCDDPYIQEAAKSVGDVVQYYLDAGCPGKRSRVASTDRDERVRSATLLLWPGMKKAAAGLTVESLRDYHKWRAPKVKSAKGGARQVDKEIVTLSNAFGYAVLNQSKTGIKANPINRDRERFEDAAKVIHCRDHMPASGDELHAIARYLFQIPRSAPLGWFALIQAITGQRANEVARMKVTASARGEAGFLDGRKLYLHRSKTHKGTYGHVDLTEEEYACLTAHLRWHAEHYPDSPWYFPNPTNPDKPIRCSALTRRLPKVCECMGIGHRTSHGMRAFRVNVLRGRGLVDAEIAIRVGQKTGGKLIVDVYGEGLDYKLKFMPQDGPPSWANETEFQMELL